MISQTILSCHRDFWTYTVKTLLIVCAFFTPLLTQAAVPSVCPAQMGRLSIPFIANGGQMDERVAFYAKTFTGTVFVTHEGQIVYSLPDDHEKKWALVEELVGATPAKVTAENKSPTGVSSFIGNDPRAWKSNLPTYGLVNLGEVYPGISFTLKTYGSRVEKIFTVAPGGSPSSIRLILNGAQSISIAPTGELEAKTDLGPVTFSAPIAYQEIAGRRIDIPVSYNLGNSGHSYDFTLGTYNSTGVLVLDPLIQARFTVGSGNDWAFSFVIDAR
jgi:hypothetical protein